MTRRVAVLILVAVALSNSPLSAQDSAGDSESVQAVAPGEWREKEKLGLGFGLVSGIGIGSHFFLDYNLRQDLQLHVSAASEVNQRTNLFGIVIFETSRSSVTGSVRYFPSGDSGWFVGGGTGFATIQQAYIFEDDVDSSATIVPIFFDGGWQGWDGYYFTINLFLGGSLVVAEEDKTQNFTFAENSAVASEDFDNAKGFSGVTIGFGWYLP